MTERVQSAVGRDLGLEAEAGLEVPNRELDMPVPTIPEEQDLLVSTQPLASSLVVDLYPMPEKTPAAEIYSGHRGAGLRGDP